MPSGVGCDCVMPGGLGWLKYSKLRSASDIVVLPAKAFTEGSADAMGEGDSVVIVDDVLATGGTAAATIRLVESLGAKVAGLVFLIELPALCGRSLIEGYEINSVLQF